MSKLSNFFKNIYDPKVEAEENLIVRTTEDILIKMEELGISKKELADKLDVSKPNISNLLNGERNMTLRVLSNICFALGISPRISLSDNCVTEENYAKTTFQDDNVVNLAGKVRQAQQTQVYNFDDNVVTEKQDFHESILRRA